MVVHAVAHAAGDALGGAGGESRAQVQRDGAERGESNHRNRGPPERVGNGIATAEEIDDPP